MSNSDITPIGNGCNQNSDLSFCGIMDTILGDLLSFDPYKYSDEELWEFLSNKEYSQVHPFHCLIVKFGNIKEIPITPPYNNKTTKKIEIYYKNTIRLRTISDFCYALTFNKSSKFGSRIITPWYWHDYSTYLNYDNIPTFLENRTLLLLYSVSGYNIYNKIINAWTLVDLKDNLNDNAKIIREYILKAQEFAIYTLITSPNEFFSVEIPESIKETILKPLEEVAIQRRYKVQKDFIEKTIGPKRKPKTIPKPSRNTYDDIEYYNEPSTEDSYLDDELDYIRQNGGDWIDD